MNTNQPPSVDKAAAGQPKAAALANVAPSAPCAVVAIDADFARAAAELATSLALPLGGDADFTLQLGPEGLQLQAKGMGKKSGASAPGPIRVDFAGGAAAHRRQFGGGSGQMIAKAVGIQPGVRPTVLDATAGLGRDAFVLAQLGCVLTMSERQPMIAALLADGLRRGAQVPEIAGIIARMHLLPGDGIALMQAWPAEPPQVIYLDPMFPHREKSALVKKEMGLLRPIVGDDLDASALLAAALALASHRVVVKRPRIAPAVDGPKPSYVLEGKSSRYDIYVRKSLKPKGGGEH